MGRIADGRAEWRNIDTEYEPMVNWQIPAIGTRELTADEALELARYLEENEDDTWLEFILLGEDPSDVVDELREEIKRAEDKAARRNER